MNGNCAIDSSNDAEILRLRKVKNCFLLSLSLLLDDHADDDDDDVKNRRKEESSISMHILEKKNYIYVIF